MTTIDQLGLDLGARLGLLLRRAYLLALPAAFADAADVLGVDVAFDVDNPFVQAILSDLATRVRDIAETTREEIRGLVGQAAAEGWSVEQLARAIEGLGEGHSRERARLIALTESAEAYSRGSIAAYRASGVVQGKEWLLGPEPCPICQGLGGQVVDLGEEFARGIAHPPAHPRCTCAIAPVLV